MTKNKFALCCIVIIAAINLASCETLLHAFADQTGRNAADALWGKTNARTE